MNDIKKGLLIMVFVFAPLAANAGQVFEVHAVDEGNILRIGEIEMPEGVLVQLPGGPNKNCTNSGEEGFQECQPLLFRPDSKTFSNINDSTFSLTSELSSTSTFWIIFDENDVPTLSLLIAGFVNDFGMVITDGEEDFQFVELYFDTRTDGPNSPNQLCAAAETTPLEFAGCFAADDVLKTSVVSIEFEAPTADFANNALFYDPTNSGHGFDFNVLQGGIVIYYYGHTVSGERLWLISEIYDEDLQYGVPFELDMYEIAEGVFGLPDSDATVWGTITFTLDDCGSGQATFSGIDGDLEMNLERLAGLPDSGCQ